MKTNLLARARLRRLLPDEQDYLKVEIKRDRTRVKDFFMFIFINHRQGQERVCGVVTLEKIYAVQLETALGMIDPTMNVRLEGSAINQSE
jgi:hypothetical protein